jgi:hypothetical protein
MRAFLTFNDIRYFNQRTFSRDLVDKAAKRDKSGSTFLSYSTQDDSLLPTIIGILQNHGAYVYIDKKDPSLPPTTSRETAEILRRNIALASKFVLLVTTNSGGSKWIPWELGLADGEKSNNKVALFPVAELYYNQSWSEQEYLGLYDRIIWGNFKYKENEWLVLNHTNNEAIRLRDWLRR